MLWGLAEFVIVAGCCLSVVLSLDIFRPHKNSLHRRILEPDIRGVPRSARFTREPEGHHLLTSYEPCYPFSHSGYAIFGHGYFAHPCTICTQEADYALHVVTGAVIEGDYTALGQQTRSEVRVHEDIFE